MAATGTITHYLTVTGREYLANTGIASSELASVNFDSGLFPYARDKLRRQKNWRQDGNVHFVYHGATSGGRRPSAEDTILDPPTTVDLTGKHLALFSAIRDPTRRPNECFLCSKEMNLVGWHAFDRMPVIPAPLAPQAPTIAQVEEPCLSTAVTQRVLNAACVLTDMLVHPVGTYQAAKDVIVDTLPVVKEVVTSPIKVAQEATSDIAATAARLSGLRISSREPWAFLDDLAEDTGTEDPIESDEEEEEEEEEQKDQEEVEQEKGPTIAGVSEELQIQFTELLKALDRRFDKIDDKLDRRFAKIDRRFAKIDRTMGAMFEYVGRGQVLAHVKRIFNIDETAIVEGMKLQGREFAKEENEPSFRRLWTALRQNYETQWTRDAIPVKMKPAKIEINFLYFCYHSGISGTSIVSPPWASPKAPLDQDFEASRSATGVGKIMSALGFSAPNAILVGEMTISGLELNNKATKRKLGQLERAIVFLCTHYSIKPTRIFAFLHTLGRLRAPARQFRDDLFGPNGYARSFPILARLAREERFVMVPA
ncbi:uncharacterized protein SPPG_07084 [Spizellomyces punctatus DAOM BR117]|uniref:Uncharacterized protein n=1 Tax=Spizellomyces punctatus (strain DAOM BR117) TaxID=645134 RepID=A0A0L0H9E1_SPIPD|nr:uncharacterized protein SPPG_07084 [Spizellomyces punctatus DAOM BR117]KNC97616.1 hypothetical protein SPPG_07084 [Spizellomyces punctatus DAOM BR117]|eukprot:XP_016605656.1 hypothetical protein SPPG_07084 [Spizellomyces punctatus DAOM BR117]